MLARKVHGTLACSIFLASTLFWFLFHVTANVLRPSVDEQATNGHHNFIQVVKTTNLEFWIQHVDRLRDKAMANLTGANIIDSDPKLISTIQNAFLDGPRPYLPKLSYSLFETPQATVVLEILNNMKSGFFVEAGGLDGERSSNTIFLEKRLQWTGLLVEMDPSWYLQLRGKNRKCHSINCCLSVNGHPEKMVFHEDVGGKGKLLDHGVIGRAQTLPVYCFPFSSLMMAMNVTHIDYLSLDVEGHELPVLKTIPWHLLDISVIGAEVTHGREGRQAYIDYMLQQGYIMYKQVKERKPEISLYANDLMFVKQSLLDKRRNND